MKSRLPQRAPSRDPLRDWFPTAKISEGRWSLLLRVRPSSAPLNDPATFALRMLRAPARIGSFAHRRLEQEVAVTHAVRHPGLVAVCDWELHGAHPFTVAPYVSGYTLAHWRKSPMRCPFGQTCWTARRIVEALGALHTVGLRHGNLHPGNVLIAEDGQAILTGLGSAMTIGALACGEELAIDPWYAAPEQFGAGSEAQGASDIYSLGAILFELLTKRPPFLCGNPEELAALHRLAPIPDLRSLTPDAPYVLSALLRKMLAKDPYRRPDALEVASILSDFEISSFRDWAAA
jgi:eukaryotic-like serine/threonine-protein kinase